jgi:hypothetical protein
MRKDVREFIRRLEAVGLTVESTPGHYRVLRDGKPLRKANGMPFTLPFSPDTVRWRRAAIVELRKLGIDLWDEGREMPKPSDLSVSAPTTRLREGSMPISAITHLFAGVPVSDLDASVDWYARFFGRPPDVRVGDEVLWEIDEHATLFIEPNVARASAGRITLAVAGLDALLERLAAQGIEHEPIETYSERRPPCEHPRSG